MLSPARSAWCTKKLNSTGTLIQRTTTEAPQGHMYYRTGCSQEDDQLLRQGCERSGSPGRPDRSNTLGTGRLDVDASATLDRSHGSNDFQRLDLRSSACARATEHGHARLRRVP